MLALPTLLMALDIGALFLALPHLTADLGTTSTQQLWITDIYGFLLAGLLITMGSLGDRIGRRKLLLIGGAAFGVASVVAAYAPTAETLIAARALLGIAGATLGPSTLALITNMFRDARERGVAIALWMTCMMGGASLGPVLGGVMLEYFWWGSVFLLGVPVMLLLLVMGPLLLPEYRAPQAGRIDLFSVVLSLGAILPIIYGIKQLATSFDSSPVEGLVALVAGLAIGTVFVRRQLRLEDPLLDLRLFRNSSVSTVLGAGLLTSASMGGIGMLSSQYLQTVLGLSPAQSALWYAPMGIGTAVGSLLTPVLTRRIRQSTLIVGGLVFSLSGFVLLALAPSAGGLVQVVIGITVIAVGSGPLFVLGAGLVVGSVEPEKAGSAASISETCSTFGSTFGIAVLGTIGAAVYGTQMRDSMVEGIPADAAETASQTVAGAALAAEGLPGAQAAELLRSAHEAFTNGLNTSAVVSGLIAVTLAILTARILRRKEAATANRPAGQEAAPQEAGAADEEPLKADG
ncbi:MFS transporter [Actinoalloteichus hoggarensis]|uniref:MFS transporter n=1 Tax=Actinoalloteichus hoggarensis TaxID=1470176 RepID=UPI001FE58ECA|nr:MFS transporter [Actinoalloteichus hoggarensis]